MGGSGIKPINVLTPVQERFLSSFFVEDRTSEPFYLSGGTALAAYYLHHRYSDDLDFFTRDSDALRFIDQRVQRAATAAGLEVERQEPREEVTRYVFSGDPHPEHRLAKIELIYDTPPYFAPPRRFGIIHVDDLVCIAVNKLTIHTRFDPKDYVDLYLIIRSGAYQLEDLIPLAKQKMVGLDEWAIAGKFQQVEALPNLSEFQKGYMLAEIDWDELIRFYQEWAARLFALFPPRRQK